LPREQNKHADRLANEALDGKRSGVTASVEPTVQKQASFRGWSAPGAPPTRLILIRHGETDHTTEKRFSGGLASANPGLNDTGREQVRAIAEWLMPVADEVDVIVSSPVRRTRESAEIIAEVFGNRAVELEDGFAEMEFGAWDGLTFLEVAEKHKDDLEEWLGSIDVAPGGGESFRVVEERVLAALDRVLTTHAGKTVAIVSHVTPIKTLVAHALEAPLLSIYRMELSPASVTVLSWFSGGPEGDIPMASMRLYNARPMETAFLGNTVP
jgi:broad specificity phosphatase PhoE